MLLCQAIDHSYARLPVSTPKEQGHDQRMREADLDAIDEAIARALDDAEQVMVRGVDNERVDIHPACWKVAGERGERGADERSVRGEMETVGDGGGAKGGGVLDG